MSLRTPEEYHTALKAEGCRTVPHNGWKTTDRPGPWNPKGIVNHHTGPYQSVSQMVTLLSTGYQDLPGPLCHAGGDPYGNIHLIGWNDTNHAGMGDPAVLTAVTEDRLPPAPRPLANTADGNQSFYGLEMIHPGNTTTPWPPGQVEAAVRYNAAICRLHGWTPNSCIYHRGWTTRKPDPVGFPTILEFRRRVAARLAHDPGWDPGEDDEMTEKQMVDALAEQLRDDDSPLSKAVRRQVRTAVENGLDERGLGTVVIPT